MNEEAYEEDREAQSETLDFTEPDYTFKPNGHHGYRQHGPYLVCKTCEIQHAVFIGMEKILVGINEDGTPILKKRYE